MKNIIYAVALGSLLISTSSLAGQGQTYFGAGYHMGTYDESGYPNANPTALGIRGGMYFVPNVAVEGRFALGLSDDTVRVFVPGTGYVDIDLKLENAISLFVKADLPVAPTAKLYGLIGFTQAETKAKARGYPVSVSNSDSGLSYGVGVEVGVNNGIYIGAEYIMYINESDYDYTGINIGVTRVF